jgi:hypothetical protein
MTQLFKEFCVDDKGQDLTEYSLLIVFVVLAAACLTGFGTDSIQGIWRTNDCNLQAANAIASGQRNGL